MKQLFLAIHYPRPEHADDLVAAMGRFGSAVRAAPGVEHVSAWRAGDRIVAISIWDSPDRIVAARPAMSEALAGVLFDVWEQRPRELLLLDEVVTATP